MATIDPRVDTYIRKARPFAQPILRQLREAVHEGCPDVEETIKWSNPSFDYKGIFCGMSAFKAHVTFGFWKHSLLVERLSSADAKAMDALGRIPSIDELPATKTIVRIVQMAARLNEEGVKLMRRVGPKKPPPKPPVDLIAALKGNRRASVTFDGFSPSQKREYVEWIVDAKQTVTREKRVATAIEWMAEGKPRHWKYMK